MKLTTDDIKQLLNKRVIIHTSNKYTYNCIILSLGQDYIKIRDKYDQIHFVSFDHIIQVEVVRT
jgi:hypothetical protein